MVSKQTGLNSNLERREKMPIFAIFKKILSIVYEVDAGYL